MAILYISTFYPSSKEPFRGHFVEKQAMLLKEKLNEKLIVIKPMFSSKKIKINFSCEKIHDIDVYTINFPNPLKELSITIMINIFLWLYNKSFYNLLKNNRINYIISNDFYSLIIGNLIKDKYNPKHLTILHGECSFMLENIAFIRRLYYKEYEKCDAIICVSNKVKKYIINKYPQLNKNKIYVNYNGLDKNVIKKYEHYSFTKNKDLTICSIGNLFYNKGFDILLSALKDIDIPYKLYIIGDGPLRKKLERYVKYNSINAIFTGNITNDEVYKYLEKSNYFILPSRNEAFGIVYLEAMITKNITIGTKGQGCEEFIVNGKNGFLINNKDDIKKYLNFNIMNNNKIVENAFRTARNFTWDRNVDLIYNLCKSGR
ncbi:glycosyltransferase family 4 protein [Thermoanaerobacterium thermosaccharolyticum]|uniref:glycosyltransferase family 4 protein n=1 Tax=Thermoanaerobacterium thermosaccharolyticum TaxID=1517 RepID=UPI001239F677|nr:glycosyltransferase family 4 protein [Thermoanaerobacterium thermosaccharolyticum]KAA5806373.1 glycosyltransferase family 4 protein [Thermoanaerobacterium thermosaccharolyticum]